MSGHQNSYEYPNCGPWGITLNDQLRTTSKLNTTFSQRGWEDAKQDGCLPQPCTKLPSWPPPKGVGFIFPTDQKKPQEIMDLNATEHDCAIGDMAVPFVDAHNDTLVGPSIPDLFLDQPGSANQCSVNSTKMGYKDSLELSKEIINAGATGNVSGDSLREAAKLHSSSYDHPWNRLDVQATAEEIQAKANTASNYYMSITESKQNSDSLNSNSLGGSYKTSPCNLNSKNFNVESLFKCPWRTLEAAISDFRNWDNLPKKGFFNKLGYILGRDHRSFYWVIWLIWFLLVVIVILLIIQIAK